jgi:hypothetical protein
MTKHLHPDDDKLLAAMGLNPQSLSADKKLEVLGDIIYTLNMRVAERLVAQLEEDQADELEALMDEDKQAEIKDWLKTNVPNYQQMIEDEAQSMRAEHSQTMKGLAEELDKDDLDDEESEE